jgi:hypothetical protein
MPGADMTERLTTLVRAMWGTNCPVCHHTVALYRVAREGTSSPAEEAVKVQIDKMLANEREWCVLFDNLRSLVGTWEREQGVENPAFYEGEINKGRTPTRCSQSAMLNVANNPDRRAAATEPISPTVQRGAT